MSWYKVIQPNDVVVWLNCSLRLAKKYAIQVSGDVCKGIPKRPEGLRDSGCKRLEGTKRFITLYVCEGKKDCM